MIDHALMLNPNSALAWFAAAGSQAMQGQADPAIEALQRAMRLSPLDPLRWTYFLRNGLLRMWWRGASRRQSPGPIAVWANNRAGPSLYRLKAVAYAHTFARRKPGNAHAVRSNYAGVTISGWQRTYGAFLCTPETLAMYVDGLREAGLPEE